MLWYSGGRKGLCRTRGPLWGAHADSWGGSLYLCLSCSWGLGMEHGTVSVPAALPYYVAFSQLLGLTVVAVTGAWLGLYRGGIAWESSLQFNVHPLCMVIGMIFLQGDGESHGASSPQSLFCASVYSCLWERQCAGILSPQTFLPLRQII